ncbi:MAG: hypothetical protein JST20_12900 [Bacteroidetes bacterium]|nr:hypothetical protein [Bacteroidota bacterium]
MRSVITDMKLPDGSDGFLPEATMRNYYYPFGMERPLMTASTGTQSYRYGYNGMEKDNAVSPQRGNRSELPRPTLERLISNHNSPI